MGCCKKPRGMQTFARMCCSGLRRRARLGLGACLKLAEHRTTVVGGLHCRRCCSGLRTARSGGCRPRISSLRSARRCQSLHTCRCGGRKVWLRHGASLLSAVHIGQLCDADTQHAVCHDQHLICNPCMTEGPGC